MELSSVINIITQAAEERWKELNLSRRDLSELPPEIGQLTKLTFLDLGANQLTALPESIGKLTNLTSLNLSRNKLNTLPESIGTALGKLRAEKNK